MGHTDLTVAAIVYRNGRYLFVEERSRNGIMFGQPGGHIEAGESPEQALEREVLEETGCRVVCSDLVGVYLWVQPETYRQFLRIMYVADYLSCDETLALDDGVVARHWMRRDDIESRASELRSPAVLRSIEDFERGRREPDALLAGMLPLSRHVERVMAKAELV
jgi:8-oxo-dGTP pyrophosphatase MutT (NUDIX family)